MIEITLLFVLLTILVYLDTYTTKLCVENSEVGIEDESNPIARFIIKKWGYIGLNAFKTLALVLFGLYTFTESSPYVLLIGLITLHVFIVAWNTRMYYILIAEKWNGQL